MTTTLPSAVMIGCTVDGDDRLFLALLVSPLAVVLERGTVTSRMQLAWPVAEQSDAKLDRENSISSVSIIRHCTR